MVTVQADADPLCWLSNPNHPRFQAAMKNTCIICHAKPKDPCQNTIDPDAPLPGRLIHTGRIAY